MINAEQIIIMLSSCVAISLLTTGTEKARRVGSLIGLIGQPFWLWSTFEAGQWGMFVVSAWFTYRYIVGADLLGLLCGLLGLKSKETSQPASFTHLFEKERV